MAIPTQQSQPYTEIRAIGVCTRSATVKLVGSMRTDTHVRRGRKSREQ